MGVSRPQILRDPGPPTPQITPRHMEPHCHWLSPPSCNLPCCKGEPQSIQKQLKLLADPVAQLSSADMERASF